MMVTAVSGIIGLKPGTTVVSAVVPVYQATRTMSPTAATKLAPIRLTIAMVLPPTRW
jgi:hypothetical protein